MNEDKLILYFREIISIDVNLEEYNDNETKGKIIYDDNQIFTFNGFPDYVEYTNSIYDERLWVDFYFEKIIANCQQKYKALNLVADVTRMVSFAKSNFEKANDPLHNPIVRGKMVYPIEKIKNHNIQWDEKIEIGSSGYPNSNMEKIRNVILHISKVQLDCLNNIEESAEHWNRKIERIPDSVEWKNNDVFEVVTPPIIIDENVRLTHPHLKLKNPLDKYQIILLYHYLEKRSVFFKDYNDSDKAKLLYLLSTHNEQDLRENIPAIRSIKDDTVKNQKKRKQSLYNLNTLRELISNLLDDINSDIQKLS